MGSQRESKSEGKKGGKKVLETEKKLRSNQKDNSANTRSQMRKRNWLVGMKTCKRESSYWGTRKLSFLGETGREKLDES